MSTLIGMIIGVVIGYEYKDSIRKYIVKPIRKAQEECGKIMEPKGPDRP